MTVDTFTSSSGTWLTPSTVTSVFIELYGGGGGGSVNGPAGGGGGGYVAKTITTTTGSGINWQVGGGGAGANNNALNGNSSIVAYGGSPVLNAGGGTGGRLSGSAGGGGTATGGDTNTVGSSGLCDSVGTAITPYSGGRAGGPAGGLGGGAGVNGSAPGGGGGGNGLGSGAFGQISFTYTIPSTTISGFVPLYISTGCAAGLLSSGDTSPASTYPSGHWFNYLGGSGLFWNYINTDPNSQVTDTDWIFTTQSGFLNRTSKVWYSSLTGGTIALKSYDLTSTVSTSLISGVGLNFDVQEGWIFSTDYSTTAQLNVQRDNSEYSTPLTLNSSSKNILTPGSIQHLIYDRKNKRIFYILVSSNSIIYAINANGTNSQIIYSSTSSFRELAIDYRNNKLYAFGLLIPSVPGGVVVEIDLTTLSTCTTSTDTNSFNYFTYGTKSSNFYITGISSPYLTTWNRTSSCSLGSPSTLSGLNNNNIFSVAVDEWNNKLYFASGTSKLLSSALDGTSISPLKIDDVRKIRLNGPGYTSRIDFNLTDLPPGFGTTSTNEQVTNAYISIRGKEGYDWTNVYAKIIKSDLQTILWENYPESCAQFPVASGQMALNIGYTGSVINSSYNTLADWNNAILRIECYSINDTQPSGNFTIYSAQVNAFCSGSIIQGTSVSGSVTCFLPCAGTSSGTIPLFLPGQFVNSGCTLYINGNDLKSGIIPLYISGAFPNASIPLFMLGQPTVSNSGFIPLTITSLGSGVSGVFGSCSLSMTGNQTPHGSLPLYILNQQTSSISGFIPLWMAGALSGTNGFVPLFIANTHTESGIPLFIQGNDTTVNPTFGTAGGNPFSQSIPLFMNRPNFVTTMSLFICNQQVSGGIPLYQQGAIASSGVISLVIPKTTASGVLSVPVMIVGW